VLYTYTQLHSESEQIACHNGNLSGFQGETPRSITRAVRKSNIRTIGLDCFCYESQQLYSQKRNRLFLRERQWQSSSRSQLILGQTDVAYDAIETGCIGTWNLFYDWYLFYPNRENTVFFRDCDLVCGAN
jgi:hypothetical protein